MEDNKSYILWYNSKTHLNTRYFVGTEKVICPACGQKHIDKPTWTYEKGSSTILDGLKLGMQTKLFAEQCGYVGLILEPIDEEKQPVMVESEMVH